MRALRSVFVAPLAAACLAAAASLVAVTSAAQPAPSLDGRTWQPSIDPEASLVLEPTITPGAWQWNLGASLQYEQDPVVLGAARGTLRPLAHVLGADLVAGIGLGARAAVGLDVPVIGWEQGDDALPATVIHDGRVPTAALGDIALLGKATILSNDRQGLAAGFGLAALGSASFPSGDRASFGGDGSVTVSLRLLAEYAVGVASLRASLGYSARTADRTWPQAPETPDGDVAEVDFGDSIPWAAGVDLRPKILAVWLDPGDRQLWELAAHGALPAGPVAPFGLGEAGASALSPVLVALDDRIALGHDLHVLAGVDFGLDSAIGTPIVRGVVSLGWAPRAHDRDSDGIPDDADECPDLPEDRDGVQDADGCPEDDAESDGAPK